MMATDANDFAQTGAAGGEPSEPATTRTGDNARSGEQPESASGTPGAKVAAASGEADQPAPRRRKRAAASSEDSPPPATGTARRGRRKGADSGGGDKQSDAIAAAAAAAELTPASVAANERADPATSGDSDTALPQPRRAGRKPGPKAVASEAGLGNSPHVQETRAQAPAATPTTRKRKAPAVPTTPAKAAARTGSTGRRKRTADGPGAGQPVEQASARQEPSARRQRAPEAAGAGAAAAASSETASKDVAVTASPTRPSEKRKGAVAKQDNKRWSPLAAYAKAGEKLLVRMRPEKVVTPDEVIAQIRKGPQGPKVIAAFDFDGTLVGGFTGAMLMQERFRRKEVKFSEIAETAGVTFKAMAKLLEANEVVAHSMAQWAGKTEEEMEELSSHLYENKIQDAVFPEMRKILAAHREAGHTIVVATSASRYQVAPTVQALGIDELLCTDLEVAEGKLTGKLVGDSLFGPGKVAAIKRFVAEHGSTLADTHFYADGDEECALMDAVGYPHPVNPSRKLTDAARANGWPVLRFQSRGGAKAGDFVRGVRGLISIMPILQAGLAVGLLSRDKRQVANMIMPTWIHRQLDLAGVKLRVSGRKNLWTRRPAVFIFNHRNNFDGSFVAALVRTDYVSIAKADMAKNPVGKLVAAIMPTVFIERGSGDAKSAAEALQPVVEAVGRGYSIMLAPEGTRVMGHLNSVGPFKKGAFHMAMAAGIPVVPVVIRNALDVASRDGGAMRPGTVDLAVLPPISVEDWTRENMTEKVEEVRQLFIETLNNWPEPDEDEIEE